MNIKKLLLFAGVVCPILLSAEETVLVPKEIPGKIKADFNKPSAGYGSSTVQTQLRVDLKDTDQTVRFIRTNTDPLVLTKLYTLKNAEPYAIRGYLLTVVRGTQISGNPVQVDAVKFNNGRGVLLVSAEDYRFRNNGKGDSIDEIIARLDQKGLRFSSGRPKYVYFPKANTAANLKEMIANVGAVGNDVEFTNGIDVLLVDGNLNALFIAAPHWSQKNIREQLAQYDRPMPEVRITYQLLEISTENDDKIGLDFQSWKNNDGVSLFSTGGRYRSNWANTFSGGVARTQFNKTQFFNFNPKWNTRYLDFLSSTGRAKVVTRGVITAKNRRKAVISAATGLFYEEKTPIPATGLNDRIVDGKTKLPADANLTLKHGNTQTTKSANGFKFKFSVTPVVTSKASTLPVSVSGVSLLGWNSDGSPRLNTSKFNTVIQIGNEGREFVIGGIKRINQIRSVSGVPLLKDLPLLGWLFSTETETIRSSELVLIARAEISTPRDPVSKKQQKKIQGIKNVLTRSQKYPFTNLGFEQFWIDSNKIE